VQNVYKYKNLATSVLTR